MQTPDREPCPGRPRQLLKEIQSCHEKNAFNLIILQSCYNVAAYRRNFIKVGNAKRKFLQVRSKVVAMPIQNAT